MVTVSRAFGERGAVSRMQHGLPLVFDERELTFKNVDELVLVASPVTLT